MQVSIDDVKETMEFIVSQYRKRVSEGYTSKEYFHMALDNLQGIRLLMHYRDVQLLYKKYVLEVNEIRNNAVAPAVLGDAAPAVPGDTAPAAPVREDSLDRFIRLVSISARPLFKTPVSAPVSIGLSLFRLNDPKLNGCCYFHAFSLDEAKSFYPGYTVTPYEPTPNLAAVV